MNSTPYSEMALCELLNEVAWIDERDRGPALSWLTQLLRVRRIRTIEYERKRALAELSSSSS